MPQIKHRQQANPQTEMFTFLAEKSLQKHYRVTNLYPFSSTPNLQQIQAQINHIVTPQNTTVRMKTKDLLDVQFHSLFMKKGASLKNKKRSKSRKSNEKKFVSSLLKDSESQFFQDYTEDFEYMKKNHLDSRKGINKKMIEEYQTEVSLTSKAKKNKEIVKFRRKKNVVQPYTLKQADQLPYSKVNPKSQLELNKEDIAVYSRSAKKLLYYQHEEVKKISFTPRMRFKQNNRQIYLNKQKIINDSSRNLCTNL